MLPPLYQKHLENQLGPSKLLFFKLTYYKISKSQFRKMATALILPIFILRVDAKKVQRFYHCMPIREVKNLVSNNQKLVSLKSFTQPLYTLVNW